jgi:hypothetical protein
MRPCVARWLGWNKEGLIVAVAPVTMLLVRSNDIAAALLARRQMNGPFGKRHVFATVAVIR